MVVVVVVLVLVACSWFLLSVVGVVFVVIVVVFVVLLFGLFGWIFLFFVSVGLCKDAFSFFRLARIVKFCGQRESFF